MRRAAVIAALVMAAAGGLLLRAPAAWGCSCIAASTAEHFERAGYVFDGTVTVVEQGSDHVRASFALSEIFKGRLPRTLDVRTARDEAACGFGFIVGTRYTVFAEESDAGVVTGLCDGTTDDPAVRLDVRALASDAQEMAGIETDEPVAAPAAPAGTGTSRSGPLAAAAVLLAIAGMGVLIRWRRIVASVRARSS